MSKDIAFSGRTVTAGTRSWDVQYPIHDVRHVHGYIIVLYDYTAGPPNGAFHNIEAFDAIGRKVWTVENPTTDNNAADAYVEFVSDALLVAWNFACYRCTIDPATGRLVESVFTK